MNAPIHRLGLVTAALVVVVTIGGFFVVDGYLAANRVASAASPVDRERATVRGGDRDPLARAGLRAAGSIAPGHPCHQDGSSGPAAGRPRHRARYRW